MKKPKPFKMLPGYYDPADYILVHRDYLAELKEKAALAASCPPHEEQEKEKT